MLEFTKERSAFVAEKAVLVAGFAVSTRSDSLAGRMTSLDVYRGLAIAGRSEDRLYEHFFATWLSPINTSLAYALLWLGLMTILYRRRIFIKV